MVCNEEMCLPPDYLPFEFDVQAGETTPEEVETEPQINASTFAGMNANEGILEPVKWAFAIENETASGATFVATATIDETWHLYSTKIDMDAGPDTPIPTSFNFVENKGFVLDGEVEEAEPHIAYDPKLRYGSGLP